MRNQRPHKWKTGPDPVTHAKYNNWIQQRNQANYRREPWQLTFEQWCAVWGDDWHRKGRGAQDLCMTRIDPSQAWHPDNVMLITRRDHVFRQDQFRSPDWRRGPRKPYRRKVAA